MNAQCVKQLVLLGVMGVCLILIVSLPLVRSAVLAFGPEWLSGLKEVEYKVGNNEWTKYMAPKGSSVTGITLVLSEVVCMVLLAMSWGSFLMVGKETSEK